MHGSNTSRACQPPIGAFEAKAQSLFYAELAEHRSTFNMVEKNLSNAFVSTLAVLKDGLNSGGKLLFFGNGGSAADAQHIAAELVIRYKTDRPAIAAISLCTDSSIMTACANDLGFELLFERQIAALGRERDVAIGISTSGKSPNVLKGIRQASRMGLRTVGLTGGNGGELPALCDATLVVPSTVTARIQEMHILIGHLWCKALEQSLGLV